MVENASENLLLLPGSLDLVNILVVDDTPANLLMLESILSKPGRSIIKASSGKEALKILLNQDFALILLDVNMPTMDGLETASLIRQRQNSETTPIIFMTAYADSEVHKSRGYSLGAVDFIFSPIVPEILQSKVAVFSDLYRKTAEIRRLHADLQQHATGLERMVEERTFQLSNTNEKLKLEITERKRAENQLKEANQELIRLNKLKSDFTSMVTHELRTPLSCIQMAILLILDGDEGPLTQKQKDTLTICKTNVERLAKLIENVLDLSKIDSGKIEMIFDRHDLTNLLREVFDLMSPVADKKGVQFSLESPEAPYFVVCDADKVKQLVINLVDNAIKFTPEKKSVVLKLFERHGSAVIETVDSGIGIKKADSEKIFEMFTQLHDSSARKARGLGIGLAVCRQIAELHQGTLTIESSPKKGSKFIFTFPKEMAVDKVSSIASLA
jgi:signal transduction histidine kinase